MTTLGDISVKLAQAMKDPEREICATCWLPFALLYDELIKEGVPRLQDLDELKKREYWNKTKGVQGWSMKTVTKRLYVVKALYVFDLITKE